MENFKCFCKFHKSYCSHVCTSNTLHMCKPLNKYYSEKSRSTKKKIGNCYYYSVGVKISLIGTRPKHHMNTNILQCAKPKYMYRSIKAVKELQYNMTGKNKLKNIKRNNLNYSKNIICGREKSTVESLLANIFDLLATLPMLSLSLLTP